VLRCSHRLRVALSNGDLIADGNSWATVESHTADIDSRECKPADSISSPAANFQRSPQVTAGSPASTAKGCWTISKVESRGLKIGAFAITLLADLNRQHCARTEVFTTMLT